jgi:hypothetical protein
MHFPVESSRWRALGRALFLCLGLMAATLPAASIPLRLEELVAISDEVVTGRVTSIQTEVRDKKIITTARVQVIESLKGKSAGTELLVSSLGGRHGQLVMEVPQVPKFHTGEEAVLFLSKPASRLPKSSQDKLDKSSPLVANFQVVGGHLGRFNIVDGEGLSNFSRKGSEEIPSTLTVGRRSIGRGSDTKSVGATLEDFKSAVSDLVSAEKTKRAQKGAEDKITGVVGKFAIPEKSTNAIIRSFDPLPAIAYATPEEYQKLNEAAKAAARKAAEGSAKQTTQEGAK